jgi:hypothetical protein
MAVDALADGFVKLCLDDSLNFAGDKCRILIEGQYCSTAACAALVTPDVVRPVTSVRDIEATFGQGTQLSEAVKLAFCICPSNAEIFVIPRQDTATSVAAEYTLTVTGPAGSSGRIELFMIDGQYAVDVPVFVGETATVIAARIAADVPLSFPYSVTALNGVITLVAKNKGVIGNGLQSIYNWRGLVGYAPYGVSVTQAQTVVGTGAPLPLDYKTLLGECCYNCFIGLIGTYENNTAWQTYVDSRWDCNSPQCFGHAYQYVQDDKMDILAQAANSASASILAICPTSAIPAWYLTTAYGALSCCTACSSPEISIQGPTYGVLTCLRMPESCTSCWTPAEEVELSEKGFVIVRPLSGGGGTYTNPYIVNDITNSLYDSLGRSNTTFRDTSSRRMAQNTAVAVAEQLAQFNGLGLFTKNTDIRRGTFGTNPRLMLASLRRWAKSQIGIKFSEFDNIDSDLRLVTDAEIKPACQGIPGKLHLFMRYKPPVRIVNVSVTLQPSLLENCNR